MFSILDIVYLRNSSLVVDSDIDIARRVGRLGENKLVWAVLVLSALNDYTRQGSRADRARNIRDVVAGKLEIDSPNAGVVFAEEEL
jgi:hypothetical protein